MECQRGVHNNCRSITTPHWRIEQDNASPADSILESRSDSKRRAGHRAPSCRENRKHQMRADMLLVTNLMTAPNCPKCAKPMTLLDAETQRHYCYRDDILYLGSESRWIGLDEEPQQVSTLGITAAKQKSTAVGLIANFLVTGAGLMYAGNWAFGMLYLVATVALAFLVWPLALVVALASYAHTVLAVQAYNMRMVRRPPDNGQSPPAPATTHHPPLPATEPRSLPVAPHPASSPAPLSQTPIPATRPDLQSIQLGKRCAKCGALLPTTAAFCRECGHAQKPQVQSVDARRQSVSVRASAQGSCQYCGAKMSNTSKVCKMCGCLNP